MAPEREPTLGTIDPLNWIIIRKSVEEADMTVIPRILFMRDPKTAGIQTKRGDASMR